MDEELQVESPTQDEPATATAQRGSEDEAVNAFDKRAADKRPTAEDDPETPADETTDASDEEPGDGEPEEGDDPAETLVEVEYEGKTYTVPPELQKAVLRQADYSRNMNEVAAQKKDYTQRIEQADKLIEGAGKLAEVLAEVNGIDAQLKQYEKVDWQSLRTQNPAEFAAAAAEMQMLRLSRNEAATKAQGLDRQLNNDRLKDAQSKRAEMVKTLQKDLPGWGDELGTKVTQYALSKGWAIEEIGQVTDPRWVVAMDKARKFDAIQDGKAAVKSKAQKATPVVRPGAPRPTVNHSADAMSRLRKTHSDDDAIAAFDARFKR